MKQFALSPFKVENYGLCVVEDFVPYSDTRALISAGPNFRELNFIGDVKYDFQDTLKLSDIYILRRGAYLRLGHWDAEEYLLNSDGWKGAHQPFYYNGRIYYSNDAPTARLYCDGKLLIDHWGDIAELGNPWVTDERIWFEARDKNDPAPEGWVIHHANHKGGDITYFCPGANPCIYKEMLYYGIWNGSSFDFARRSVKQDALITASMERYTDYLCMVYNKMSRYIAPSDTVMEICTRHDRGILGKQLLPHNTYIMVDRDPKRPGHTLDALKDELPGCDILLSTALLHHTSPENLVELFKNLEKNTRKKILINGPNVAVLPDLFGDHLYHINTDQMESVAKEAGWWCTHLEPSGLSKPFCEVLMVFERKKS